MDYEEADMRPRLGDDLQIHPKAPDTFIQPTVPDGLTDEQRAVWEAFQLEREGGNYVLNHDIARRLAWTTRQVMQVVGSMRQTGGPLTVRDGMIAPVVPLGHLETKDLN